MTATELQNIVRVLANQGWTRYWLMWETNPGQPAKMAISCIDGLGRYEVIPEAESKGFRRVWQRNLLFYVIDRTNEDGSPFISSL